jgi:hypothetical protein
VTGRFIDGQGQPTGSTDFAKFVLAEAAGSFDQALAAEILAESNWRKNYQQYFRRFSWLELSHPEVADRALAAMGQHYQDEQGQSPYAQALRGFQSREAFDFEAVVGTRLKRPIVLPSSASGLTEQQATIDALRSLDFVRANPNLDLSNDLLVAIAGNAELSGARDWLSWGGSVALIARKNDRALQRLIDHAKTSAGTLYFVAEGLDPISQIENCGAFVRQLSTLGKRMVFASYGYAPGSKQIELQIAQDAILSVALNLPKQQLAFSWLGTPLDVIAANPEIVRQQIAAYRGRGFTTKLRDFFWQIFGELKPAEPEIDGELEVGIFDASANRQGPSYLLAKHSERWRALVAARQGALVSFTVAPPAETTSVLGAKKVLARTYRGLRKLGVNPLPAADTATLMAGILARNLHDELAPTRSWRGSTAAELASLTSATSIHAGLWTMPYRIDSIWVAATVIG